MGYKILLAAFVFSLVSIAALIIGGITKKKPVLVGARAAVAISCGLVTAAVGFMIFLLLTHNFSYEYVAMYTSGDLSPVYLVGALWAGNLGTMLFWAWLISIVAVLVLITIRGRSRELMPFAAAVVMVTEAFLLGLLVFIQNPFGQMAFGPSEGLGLNPLLENFVMLVHPPVIMTGYAAITVPFALAIAALVTGKLDNDWVATTRRWTLFAWLLLGAGIISGGWFSYVRLGEGLFWHWEPVENVSLVPWLSLTALLHSLSIQRKRGIFKIWTMLLITLTFGVIIFATMVSRSEIISSIASFTDSAFGPAFLYFLVAAMGIPAVLIALRHNRLKSERQIEHIVSREGTFLLTNLVLVSTALVILLGTVFLLVNTDARNLQNNLAVPFYTRVCAPLLLFTLLLTGVCTVVGWKHDNLRSLGRDLVLPLTAGAVIAVAVYLFGLKNWYAAIGLGSCLVVPFAVISEWIRFTRSRHRARGENYVRAFFSLIWADKPRNGGYIVHIALVMIAAGIIGTSAYSISAEKRLLPGDSMTVGAYTLTYERLNYTPATGRMIFLADMSVYRSGKLVGTVVPRAYFDRSFNGDINTAAIRSTLIDDLYVTINGWDETGLTEFKASIYPLAEWIWVGGCLMILGGLVAFWPDSRKTEGLSAGDEDQDS